MSRGAATPKQYQIVDELYGEMHLLRIQASECRHQIQLHLSLMGQFQEVERNLEDIIRELWRYGYNLGDEEMWPPRMRE